MQTLISEQQFKSITNVSSSLTNINILDSIKRAEIFNIVPIISRNMYNELLAQVSGNTLTPDNMELMEYLAPAIAYYTLHKLYEDIYVSKTNAGVMLNGSSTNNSNSTPVDLDTFKFLKQKAYNDAEEIILLVKDLIREDRFAAAKDDVNVKPKIDKKTIYGIYFKNM